MYQKHANNSNCSFGLIENNRVKATTLSKR